MSARSGTPATGYRALERHDIRRSSPPSNGSFDKGDRVGVETPHLVDDLVDIDGSSSASASVATTPTTRSRYAYFDRCNCEAAPLPCRSDFHDAVDRDAISESTAQRLARGPAGRSVSSAAVGIVISTRPREKSARSTYDVKPMSARIQIDALQTRRYCSGRQPGSDGRTSRSAASRNPERGKVAAIAAYGSRSFNSRARLRRWRASQPPPARVAITHRGRPGGRSTAGRRRAANGIRCEGRHSSARRRTRYAGLADS